MCCSYCVANGQLQGKVLAPTVSRGSITNTGTPCDLAAVAASLAACSNASAVAADASVDPERWREGGRAAHSGDGGMWGELARCMLI